MSTVAAKKIAPRRTIANAINSNKSSTKRQTKGWPPERRARQAAAIRAWRPWANSTGPRTTAGKAVSARNSMHAKPLAVARRAFRQALARQQHFLHFVNACLDVLDNPGDQRYVWKFAGRYRAACAAGTFQPPPAAA